MIESESKLLTRLRSIREKYDAIDKVQLDSLFEKFTENNSNTAIQAFMKVLQEFSQQEWVLVSEIVDRIKHSKIVINPKKLKAFLDRKTVFLGKVQGKVCTEYILPYVKLKQIKNHEKSRKPSMLRQPTVLSPEHPPRLELSKPSLHKATSEKESTNSSGFLHPSSISESNFPLLNT